MSGLIDRAMADPFAGAFRYLRSIDPLYQAEIGVEREWEVRASRDTCPCDCPHCDSTETKTIIVEALTATEAVASAQEGLAAAWFIEGVRPKGSQGGYADPDDLGLPEAEGLRG